MNNIFVIFTAGKQKPSYYKLGLLQIGRGQERSIIIAQSKTSQSICNVNKLELYQPLTSSHRNPDIIC